MEYTKQNRLETYVERHRADFDLHEPRPDLWAALEQQLHGEATPAAEPLMSIVTEEERIETGRQLAFVAPVAAPAPTKRRFWSENYSIAAALVVLLLAAGLGEMWKSGRVAAERGTVSEVASSPAAADAALYLSPAGELTPTAVNQNMNARLDTAVRGMETYYVSQLADRKAELNQLAPEAAAEWTRELVDLDSSYQRLKRELPRHPRPEIVLTEMNRNLQNRLNILDQQLELRNPSQTAMNSQAHSEYALADSRQFSEASLRHDR
ncbi:MAG: hypothetical protein ACRYFZ_11030 [Janthinobacterium lividum]